MKIVLKPFGVLTLLLAMVCLTILAVRGSMAPHGNGAAQASDIVRASAAQPAAGAIAAATPSLPGAAAELTRGHSIYRHGLENGWQNWSWAKNVDFNSREVTHSGPVAIKVAFNGFDGVKFRHDAVDGRSCDRFSFLINGGPKGGQRVQLAGAFGTQDQGGPIGLVLPPLPPNKWVAVVIPLKMLGIADRPDLTAFWLQGASDRPQSPLYIDEVRLLRPEEPVPNLPVIKASVIPT